MKKERNIKTRSVIGKVTCILLTLTLGMTAFTGCGKKIDSASAFEEAKTIDKNCIYKQEDFAKVLNDGDKVTALGRNGDRILAISESAEGTFKYNSFNADGSDVQSADIGGQKDDYITTCTFDNDGNAYMVYRECSDDGVTGSFLEKVTPSGEVVYKYDITEELEKNWEYLRTMTWTEKHGLVCGMLDGLATFDEQSGFKVIVDKKALSGMGGITNVLELADNKLFVNYFDEKSYDQSFVIVNAENNKVEKKLGGFESHGYYTFFKDENNTLYGADSDGVYKYNEQSDTADKVLDYTDSSISSDQVMSQVGFIALNEKEILADTSADYNAPDSLVKLTKVNPEDVKDKTIITLSALYLEKQIKDQILEFNRTNDKYAIKIIDYSELGNGNYEDIIKQFNLDLTAGKVADIMCFSGNESAIEKYANKGILLDLAPAFEQGGPLGDLEILPNIKEMMNYNGKTYTFIPSFEPITYVVRAEDANGKTSLSYKDCDELIKSRGTDYKAAFGSLDTRMNVCSYFWVYYGKEFLDIKSKKCNFDTPEFVEFLKFTNNFPDEEPVDYVNDFDIDAPYTTGDAIFYGLGFRNIWEYAKLKQVIFHGDIEMVGCPNNLGKNLAAIQGPSFAINSKTEHMDVIYDLIRDMMTANTQSTGGFSPVKSVFEEQLQSATKEASDNDTFANTYDPVTFEDIKLDPLSEDDVKKFYDYVVAIDTFASVNMQISNIVMEEASAYFKGEKTAEEVAKIIQNRVGVYIDENT